MSLHSSLQAWSASMSLYPIVLITKLQVGRAEECIQLVVRLLRAKEPKNLVMEMEEADIGQGIAHG